MCWDLVGQGFVFMLCVGFLVNKVLVTYLGGTVIRLREGKFARKGSCEAMYCWVRVEPEVLNWGEIFGLKLGLSLIW